MTTFAEQQRLMVEAVIAGGQPEDTVKLNFLAKSSRDRLVAYHESFSGRVLDVLTDTVLEPLLAWFPRELIQDVLVRYFQATTPGEPEIVANLRDLASFVRCRGEATDLYGHLFADLADVCLQHWYLLRGPDPDQAANSREPGVLKPACLVQPAKPIHLGYAWRQSDAHDWRATDCLDADIPLQGPAHGVLLVKISPLVVISADVSAEFASLCQYLVAGQSLEGALDQLTDAELAVLSEEELAAFVQALSQQRAFQGMDVDVNP
jgi:hypothetical protein